MMKKPIVIDFFCGAGGLSLGFKKAGFNVIAGIDFDPIHVATHHKNFPRAISICDDIRNLRGQNIRKLTGLSENIPVDVVIGGPPCQGFSMIGKRNMKDPRNLLLEEFCRLVEELEPRYFVIENVAGLMCGDARNILASVLWRLKAAGFRWVTPIRILDAQNFGVPQRRKRVFVLGYKKGEKKPCYPKAIKSKFTVKDAIADLSSLGKKRTLLTSDLYIGKLGQPSAYSKKLRHGNSIVRLTGCSRAVHAPKIIRRFRSTKAGETEPISRFARLDYRTIAPTLRAGTAREYGGFTAARPIHPTQPRCITVREAARLHSFPDWFQFHGTRWHGFRQVGNAVPPLLACAIAKRIRVALNE